MRHLTRIGLLTLAMGLGIMAVILTTAGLSAVASTTEVDLVVEAKAPEHVSVDATFIVNVSFANEGTAGAPDNPVTAVLPEGVQFITATNEWGEAWAPDAVDGNAFTWDVYPLHADSTWGHIFIVLQPDLDLPEGTLLTTTVSITTSVPEPNTDDNTFSVTSQVCYMDGASKQAHARYVMPGDVITYTIRFKLAQQAGGGANGRWVTLTDTLPYSHQVRFLGWAGDVTGTLLDGHKLQWQGRMYAGEALTLQYRLGVEGDVPPGTAITNVADLGWSQQHMQLGPVTTVVTLPTGTLALGPHQGGQLNQHGVVLDVPPGAVTDTTRFQYKAFFTETRPITPPGEFLFANRAFEMHAWRFGDPVGQFNAPLTITLHYSDTDVQGLNRETLRLWKRQGPEDAWEMLGAPVSATSGTLSFTTTHFCEFALFGEALDPEVDLIVEAKAPDHVSLDEPYVVNVSFANKGTAGAPENPVTAILPEGTQYLTSTNEWGEPLAPDAVDGNTLTWNVYPLHADSTWGHIFIVLQPDLGLPEGEVLTTTVSITTSVPEPNLDNNVASVASVVCEMAGSSKQAHSRLVSPADVITYTIRLNLSQQAGGGANGRLVTLTDTLPYSHQVRFLGWAGDVTGTLIDGHKLQWQGRVYAGEPYTLQYRLGIEGDVPPGTAITNVADLGWNRQHMRLGPVSTTVMLPEGTLALGPHQGGQLNQHGVVLDVPPGAVTDTTRFQYKAFFTETRPITPPGELVFANRAFELLAWRFGDPLGQFNAPLTITVHYSDTDVSGLKRETLRLWKRQGLEDSWTMLGEPVSATSGTLSFTTTHFCEFALFGEALDPEVDLMVEAKAPEHVAMDEPYVVNVSFANKGTADAPDNPVTAILPAGTQYLTSTNEWGEPLAPDAVDGNTLTWNVYPLHADSTWGHVFIYVQPDPALTPGTLLTTTVAITTSAPEPNVDNNVASATSIVSEMGGSSKQVHSPHVLPADVITYTLRVRLSQQTGGTAQRWVALTDTLPYSHQVRFLGWAGKVTGTLIDGHKLQWQGQVRAGEALTLQYLLGVEGDVTAGTPITNVASLGWARQQLQLGPVTTVVTLPYNMLALGPMQGGQLYHPYGVQLDVPSGAVTDTTRFELEPLALGTAVIPPGSLLFSHRAFEMNAWRFGNPVGQFNAPLTITMHYSDTDVLGLNRETLRLWKREGPGDPWEILGEPVSVTSGTVSFTTTHLCQFALFAQAGDSHAVYLPLIIQQ